jgi:hypothetical protein
MSATDPQRDDGAGNSPPGTATGNPKSKSRTSAYPGPKDLGRAESLYRSAISKPDLDYSTQLLFASLIANPEHTTAFGAILAKISAFAAARRKMVVRVGDSSGNSPAEAFIKSLAGYCAAPAAEAAIGCAVEAQRIGLFSCAATLAALALGQVESAQVSLKASWFTRLIDVLDASGATEAAIRAARVASQVYPKELGFRDREKNLLASQYLQETEMESATGFRDTLRDRERQEAMHRATDIHARLDELEQRYRQTMRLEDFRELFRAAREAPSARRETALPMLQDGYDRFGERETLWFIREIRIERKQSELRQHRRLLDERPNDAQLRQDHERMRQDVLREHVDHLYEVVSSLPSTPERQRRELELAGKLFEAGRFEEAIKQAQAVKRRSENRLDAWIIMAKSFVQLGLTPEASECFQSILNELNASAAGSTSLARALEAKYAYAEFLLDEAEKTRDAELARQARKLCSDVMIEDIDFRSVRKLSVRADRILK